VAARPLVGNAPAIPRAEIILHVDVEALRRGGLEPGERCEIEGIGPVSLSTVEYLFGTSWAKLIISKGVDIASVTHFGRWIPAHLETTLSRRDQVCQVPGCGISYGLERDHIIPIEEGGPTELDNLVRLCRLCGIPHNRHYAYCRIMRTELSAGAHPPSSQASRLLSRSA
jgi:hypothetical protein